MGSRLVLGRGVAAACGGVVTKVFKVFSEDGESMVPQIQFIDVQTVLKTLEIGVLFLNVLTPRMPSMVSAQQAQCEVRLGRERTVLGCHQGWRRAADRGDCTRAVPGQGVSEVYRQCR